MHKKTTLLKQGGELSLVIFSGYCLDGNGYCAVLGWMLRVRFVVAARLPSVCDCGPAYRQSVPFEPGPHNGFGEY